MVLDKQSNSSLKVILKTEKILIIDNVFSNMSATKWLPGRLNAHNSALSVSKLVKMRRHIPFIVN